MDRLGNVLKYGFCFFCTTSNAIAQGIAGAHWDADGEFSSAYLGSNGSVRFVLALLVGAVWSLISLGALTRLFESIFKQKVSWNPITGLVCWVLLLSVPVYLAASYPRAVIFVGLVIPVIIFLYLIFSVSSGVLKEVAEPLLNQIGR